MTYELDETNTGKGVKKLYMNGALLVTENEGGLTPTTENDLFLGRRSENPALFFEGLMDEVRIYNRALPAAEIKALATPPSVPTVLSRLNGSLALLHGLPASSFRDPSQATTLDSYIDAAVAQVQAGNLNGAAKRLVNDILPKIDGCSKKGVAGPADWVLSCDAREGQILLYDILREAAERLGNSR